MEDAKSVDALVDDVKGLIRTKTHNVRVEITDHGTKFGILLDGHQHANGCLSHSTNPEDLLAKLRPDIPPGYEPSAGNYLGAGYVSFRLKQRR